MSQGDIDGPVKRSGPLPDETDAVSVPFTRQSVSIRLYPHNDLEAGAIVSEVVAQAGIALRSGFDGVMTSEHHGGFAGYMAQPLQMASFILAEHGSGWAAAAPLLLPLRSTALVAEEVAWLNAHYPGRVGLGVAIGALPLDFKIAGKELRLAVENFKSELPQLVAMLRGEDLGELANDAALRLCATHPVPILSAAVSNAAAIRAARSGAGLLVEGMSDPERVAQLCDAYDNAGGTGSKVLIRRTWLGALPSELVDRQRAIYDSYSNSATAFGNDQTVTAESPTELIERLAAIVASTGVDALNLRVHLPGVAPQAAREQIEMLGSMVVTPLKKAWPG